MTASTVNIRLDKESHDALKALAEQRQATISGVIRDAIRLLERETFFQQADAALARMQADPEAWEDELRERAEWDSALADGLKD